jgi:DNA-directed RNA polymerase subunit omega
MARVTVEDCIKRVPNRFDLVVAASQRSREISNGMQIEVERDNDKNPVVSLREIAEDAVDPAALHERFIRSMQKNIIKKEVISEEESSVEDEFSAYLSNSNSGNKPESDFSVKPKNTDMETLFDDVSNDLIRNED